MFITTDQENDLGEFPAFFEGEAKVLEGFLNAEIAKVKPQGSQRGVGNINGCQQKIFFG